MQAPITYIFLILCFSTVLRGQYKFDESIRFNEENGLPSAVIRDIHLGRDGFVWIATNNGLCRFDGIQFKTYQYDPSNPHSLYDNRTLQVLTTENEVWVGTRLGLSILDLRTDRFRNYQLGPGGATDTLIRSAGLTVNTIYEDRQNTMWIGTRSHGVFRYRPEANDFIRYSYPAEKVLRMFASAEGVSHILSFVQDVKNDSIIWSGTLMGLLEINKYSDQVKWHGFARKDKIRQSEINVFRIMHQHDDGLIYVGAWGATFNVFDPVNRTFSELPMKEQPATSLLIDPKVSIIPKNSNELWLTTISGIALYNIKEQKITFYKDNVPRAGKFYGIESIDEQNRVWFRSIDGIHLFDPLVQQFDSYSYAHLNEMTWGFAFYHYQHQDNRRISVFPRDADGIFHFDKNRQTWQKTSWFRQPQGDRPAVNPRGIAVNQQQEVVISSLDHGLLHYSIGKDEVRPFEWQPTLQFRQFGEILWDSHDQLWLSAGVEGLFRWDANTGKERQFKPELETSSPFFKVSSVAKLFEDSHNNIWFRRNEGFSMYWRAKDTIINFLHFEDSRRSFKSVKAFAEDGQGRLWLSGPESWVGILDLKQPHKGILKKFNIAKYTKNNPISYIRSAPDGYMWAYADRLVLRIDPKDFSISSYSFQYKHGSRDPLFFSFDILPTGELILGHRNSIVLANPSKLQRNTELPVPYIASVDVLGKPLQSDTAVLRMNSLNLQHWQNFLSIEFSAKAYTLGHLTRFRYRLRGFEDWVEANGRRFANYTNVPGGNYVFQVQAANNEGIWNPQPFEMPVHIATAWWASWWFRFSLLGFVGLAIYSLYQYRLGQIRQKERLKTQFEKKLANVEMSALLAQMNPHFLFNCLNSIDSYILQNQSKKASEYLNDFARLIRLILQNSRSNYISLKDELETLELYLQMERMRFRDKFQYEIIVHRDIETSSVDIPPMLMQPYVENAIWHGLMHNDSKKEGKVKLIIGRSNGSLQCIIEDNGIGREKARAILAQRKYARKKSMGMTITKDRLDIIKQLYNLNAEVEVIDLKDDQGQAQGTRVILSIPI